MKLATCLAPFYWSTIDPYSSLKFQIFSYTCYYYAPINVNPHLLGIIGEIVGNRLFEKSNSPPIGERLVVKSPCSMAGMYFRKFNNTYSLQVETNAKNSKQSNTPLLGQNFC